MQNTWPKLGCGVGLRPVHYPAIIDHWPQVDWFEAISENYMDSGGRPLAILEKVRTHYPIGLHGIALSIGSVDPLNDLYLRRLKALVDRIEPVYVSDHLCWAGAGGHQLHDLLPLPFTPETVRHVAERVIQVQEFLKRPILLENVSTYVTYKHSVMPEWEFLSQVAKVSGCGILLDLNNIYVNSVNHGFDPITYLDHIPGEKVGQFHLAGHTDMGDYLFDTHSRPVIGPVWNLYHEALKRWGQIATLIEWDDDIPEFPKLMEECGRAKAIYIQYENHYPEISERSPSPLVLGHSPFSLQEIQQWMKNHIEPVRKKPQGESFLNPQKGTPGVERMEVYAEGYKARTHEALSEIYETIRQLLGHEKWHELTDLYAEKFPSVEYNLNVMGKQLPELIRQHPIKDMPFLQDLARLEWLVSEAFHAFDQKPFERAHLAKIVPEDWEYAQLCFQPSVSLFTASWPVMDLWKNRKDLKPASLVKEERQYLLVSRQEFQIRCELLNEFQHHLIQGLLCGKTLGEVSESLAALGGDEVFPIAEWFTRWVHDGLIAECNIKKKILS